MDNYKPKIHKMYGNVYVEMLLEANECPLCGKVMIKKSPSRFNNIFPNYFRLNQDAQMKEAGMVYESDIEVDGEWICVECAKAGKATFLCALCGERKPSDTEQESFGIGAFSHYLCKDCYETVSANVWDKKCKELRNKHKYDYE
jgi:hypothetical protein